MPLVALDSESSGLSRFWTPLKTRSLFLIGLYVIFLKNILV